MTLGLQDPAFLAAASVVGVVDNVLDIIEIGRTATANVFRDFSYIRKALMNSTTATLLNYVSVGSFNGPEGSNLPVVQFTSSTSMYSHPGATSRAVGVRWTSPVAGTVYVSGTYTKDQVGTSNGVRVVVYKNNISAVVGPVTINTSPATMSFTRVAVTVAVGDTLDFIVENNNSNSFDNTTCSLLKIELS